MCSGVMVLSRIGRPAGSALSLSGAISMVAVSSSRGSIGRMTRARKLRSTSSSSSADTPNSTTTP
jgi:hypothetical protein